MTHHVIDDQLTLSKMQNLSPISAAVQHFSEQDTEQCEVFLFKDLNGAIHCGGTVISEYLVITAAHCFYHEPRLYKFQIHFCTTTLQSSDYSQLRLIDHVCPHYKYSTGKFRSFQNDIAIIRVDKPFEFNEHCFAGPKIGNRKFEIGTSCQTVGWGHFNNAIYPEDLEKVSVKVVEADKCVKRNYIHSNMICAGIKYKADSCTVRYKTRLEILRSIHLHPIRLRFVQSNQVQVF